MDTRASQCAVLSPPLALAQLRVEIHGAVQGVGFRPFVYRLATELDLTGWVINDARGVFIEVEGRRKSRSAWKKSCPSARVVLRAPQA